MVRLPMLEWRRYHFAYIIKADQSSQRFFFEEDKSDTSRSYGISLFQAANNFCFNVSLFHGFRYSRVLCPEQRTLEYVICYIHLYTISFFSLFPCPFFSISFSNHTPIQTSIHLQKSASIQPITGLSKYAKNIIFSRTFNVRKVS